MASFQKETFQIEDRICNGFLQPNPDFLLIQAADEHDEKILTRETELTIQGGDVPFVLATFRIRQWFDELTPWTSPPVFGHHGFGDGAQNTLAFLENAFIPAILSRFSLDRKRIRICLGGYSLVGLFALWCGYQSKAFEGITAVSPSVWYPKWTTFMQKNSPLAKDIYLSLGKDEEKTKNQVMAKVGDNIRLQANLLQEAPSIRRSLLEWNEGNHFANVAERMAKGWIWLMRES